MAFTEVDGFVTKVKAGGKGFVVEERWTSKDGKAGAKKWQVWFDDQTSLVVEQRIKVRGQHGDAAKEFEKDGDSVKFVERSINNAKILADKNATTPIPEPVPEPAWAPSDTSEIPF